MKDKPIVIVITLLGGIAASLTCIFNGANLLGTLITVFVSLICFLIIGLIVNSIIAKQRFIAEERLKDEKMLAEEEEKRRAMEEGEAEEGTGDETDEDR